MRTITDFKETIKKHRQDLERDFKVKKIGLFGSYIREEQKKGSDLDVLVEFTNPISLFKFIELEEYLKKLLSIKIDLVSRKALKPHIGEHILRETIYI